MQPIATAVATEQDRVDWDGYVERQAHATGYHDWQWRAVFRNAFEHEPVYLLARGGGREIAGVLPLVLIQSRLFGRSLTSLPFLNYGGVLASSPAAADALFAAAVQLARSRGCRHLELRHVERQFPLQPCRQHKVTMRLGLQGDLWSRVDRKVRNQIRKAEKSNLIVRQGGPDLLDPFYAVFARNMRDLGTPVYSKRLFREVLHAFPDRCRIVSVFLGERPVAAGFTYRARGTMEIPWASSIRDFNSLCPNHLLYWHALQAAVTDGCSVFDFGRSTPGEGTYKFKEQWGAQPLALHWEYWLPAGAELPDQGPTNPKFRTAIALWQRLPLRVANALGPHIVRSIP